MKILGRWPLGVCTWSYQLPLEEVGRHLADTGVNHVHLAIGPALEADGPGYIDAVRRMGWTITSTMIGFPQEDYSTLESIRVTGGVMPDDVWPRNQELFHRAADATKALRVRFLSMHAGFLDHTNAERAETFRARMRELADYALRTGVQLLLETGQESAEDLRTFLKDLAHPAIRVNFDPANMILYGKGDPLEALRTLAPWIRHVHIKDAVKATQPGAWGAEVPWGEGEAGGDVFLRALAEAGFSGALAVEREAGDDRPGDIRKAIHRCQAAR